MRIQYDVGGRVVLFTSTSLDRGTLHGDVSILLALQTVGERIHTAHGVVDGDNLAQVSYLWIDDAMGRLGVEYARTVIEGDAPQEDPPSGDPGVVY